MPIDLSVDASRGLGTVLTGMHLPFEEEAAACSEFPVEDVTQAAMFPVAYYTGETFKPARRRPLSEVLHWDALRAEVAAWLRHQSRSRSPIWTCASSSSASGSSSSSRPTPHARGPHAAAGPSTSSVGDGFPTPPTP